MKRGLVFTLFHCAIHGCDFSLEFYFVCPSCVFCGYLASPSMVKSNYSLPLRCGEPLAWCTLIHCCGLVETKCWILCWYHAVSNIRIRHPPVYFTIDCYHLRLQIVLDVGKIGLLQIPLIIKGVRKYWQLLQYCCRYQRLTSTTVINSNLIDITDTNSY